MTLCRLQYIFVDAFARFYYPNLPSETDKKLIVRLTKYVVINDNGMVIVLAAKRCNLCDLRNVVCLTISIIALFFLER